jgi:hypothetical protein
MTSLAWYVRRLRRMPPAEVPYRCLQTLKKTYDKHLRRDLPKAVAKGFEVTVPAVDLRDAAAVFPDLEVELRTRAEQVVAHRFNVFGVDAAFGPVIDWHLDPKTGRRWPLEFWGDINYRNGTKIGGIKFAWELNRLHHLPLLALAYGVTRDPLYRQELFGQLASWLAANPYPKGINWISGIELGIRLVNLTYALMFLNVDGLCAPERRTILEFVRLHGRHLCRYPSRYSSCNNHAIAEALGLYMAGAAFPGIPGAIRWKRRGRSTLEQQILRQIHPDGGSFEYSVPYLSFVTEHVLLYWLWSRGHEGGCNSRIETRLCAALELLSSLTDAQGNIPFLGDGDDGCVLTLLHEPHRNHLSLLNTGAILFDQPHWLSHGAAYDLKTYCLLGADSHEQWRRLKGSGRERGTEAHHFKASGWVAIRDQTRQALFVGNSSPLGLPPLAGHGHADALSFWLSVRGRPILVDPGTYLYHGGGAWRRYFRGTAAHNTIRVDGQDQAPSVSDFMFDRFYEVRDVRVHEADGAVVWSAWHDAYGRLTDPVIHRRVVIYDSPRGCITVEDTLECRDCHDVECFFHFHPDCRVSLAQGRATVRSGDVEITLQTDPAWDSCRCVCGQTEPILGWYSPRFNEKSESCAMVCHKSLEQTATFRTTIFL